MSINRIVIEKNVPIGFMVYGMALIQVPTSEIQISPK